VILYWSNKLKMCTYLWVIVTYSNNGVFDESVTPKQFLYRTLVENTD